MNFRAGPAAGSSALGRRNQGRRMHRDETERWLADLRNEHRDLDEVIRHLIDTRHSDTMRIQRLKKRKLQLKDMISKLESELIPDLDA
jgi:hypothetical protein